MLGIYCAFCVGVKPVQPLYDVVRRASADRIAHALTVCREGVFTPAN